MSGGRLHGLDEDRVCERRQQCSDRVLSAAFCFDELLYSPEAALGLNEPGGVVISDEGLGERVASRLPVCSVCSSQY